MVAGHRRGPSIGVWGQNPPVQMPMSAPVRPNAGLHGFKVAVAVIIFNFGVKLMVQFADILLPFIMALILVTVLEPVKQFTLELSEATLAFLFEKCQCFCCVKKRRNPNRKENGTGGLESAEASSSRDPQPHRTELHEWVKRLLLLISIVLTVAIAGRLFWLVGRIVWLSGEAVIDDFQFYKLGVQKRGQQATSLLTRYHLQEKMGLDPSHMENYAITSLKLIAEFLSQHVFYTLTQVSLTTIFVLFLLYSPVQRDFSPVMGGVFQSMETYLKLKTFISLTMGITNGCGLWVIGLELPAAWGLLTFLANYIPNIGGPTVSLLPCLLCLADARKSLYQVTAALLTQGMLHFTIANFVEPVVFGTTEEIHSVVVLLGLSFFGFIWGFTGMFLSVPLLFAIHAWLKIVANTTTYTLEAREDARFMMGVLEGRWLDDSMETAGGEEVAGSVLLTGHVDAGEEMEMVASKFYDQQESESQPPAQREDSEANSEEQPCSCLDLYDPKTKKVRWLALLARWLIMLGSCLFIFGSYVVFHLDMRVLIHPSGGKAPQDAAVTAAATDTTTLSMLASTLLPPVVETVSVLPPISDVLGVLNASTTLTTTVTFLDLR